MSVADERGAAPAPSWRASTIDGQRQWYYPLPPDCRAVIDEGVTRLRNLGGVATELRLQVEHRAQMSGGLAPVCESLAMGRGFAIVTGWDPTGCSEAEAHAVYWVVGQGLGEPFEQNVQGVLL